MDRIRYGSITNVFRVYNKLLIVDSLHQCGQQDVFEINFNYGLKSRFSSRTDNAASVSNLDVRGDSFRKPKVLFEQVLFPVRSNEDRNQRGKAFGIGLKKGFNIRLG